MKKIFYFSTILALIFSCFFTRFYNLSDFYTETDDQLPVTLMMRYKRLDLYSIANDIESKTYNSKLKVEIRKLQNLDNKFIDFSQKLVSNIISNISPSRHSTFAPLQYFLFGWMVDIDQNYKELKFNSRFPSALFSILTVYITFLLSKKIFSKKNFLYLVPPTLLVTSLPLIYISQRSYNYSAGAFALIFLCFFLIKQRNKINNFYFNYDEQKINIKKNFIISIPIVLLSYLNYMMLYFTPTYFLLNFIYSSKKNKKIFNTENKNIIITGLMYYIFLIPLLIHITNIGVLKHGMSASTAGSFFEYSIDSYKSEGFIEVVKFYFSGVYIIITENLSFFLNNSFLDNYLKLFLFLLVFVGFFTLLFNNKNQEHSFFFYFFCFCFLTWSILSYFNILSFGPTRHMQVFTPFFSIFFSFAIYKFVKKKFLDKISLILILIIILIFIPNFKEFSKKYEDLVHEKEITSLINKYDIGYISDDLSFPYTGIGFLTGICNMNSIKIKIQSCYVRFSRYKNIGVLDKNILLNLKKDSKSIAFINKKIDNETSLLLNELGYELIYNLEEINFKRNSINSPLLISKNKPNFLLIKIFK